MSRAIDSAKERVRRFDATSRAYDHYERAADLYGAMSQIAGRYYRLYQDRHKRWSSYVSRIYKRQRKGEVTY